MPKQIDNEDLFIDSLDTFQDLQGSAEEAKKLKAFEDTLDKYNQDKDADFSNIKLGGKHLLVKAPSQKRESGLILSDRDRKNLQNVQDIPTFNPEIIVAHCSEQCSIVSIGDMVLLSPHVQTLEFVVDNVLYIMFHEDFVLATKPLIK